MFDPATLTPSGSGVTRKIARLTNLSGTIFKQQS